MVKTEHIRRRVLVCDPISEDALRTLEEEGHDVDRNYGLTPSDLLETIPPYNAILVRSTTKVSREVLEAGVNLLAVGRAGTGLDNIDVEAARERRVAVLNSKGANKHSVAEYTMMLILSSAYQIPKGVRAFLEGNEDEVNFKTFQVKGKTLGLIGLGEIGTLVAKLANGFEMKVQGYDPFVSEGKARTAGVKLVDFEEVLRTSDIITLHAPLTRTTENLIGDEEFEKMKQGVIIINTARGELIDEEALLRALASGKVAHAALDVFRNEPNVDPRIKKHDSITATPHIAAMTHEAELKAGTLVVEQLITVFEAA